MHFILLLALASIATASPSDQTLREGPVECQFPDENVHCTHWKDVMQLCNDEVFGPYMKLNCAKTCKCKAPSECGKEYKPLGRISGGKFTLPNQYPWMVRLPMGCGGSLITDRHILTAEHCLDPDRTKYVGELVKVSVHNQDDEDDYETIPIKEYVYPPMDTIYHDIAIITLEHPVDLSDDTIGTICLPASTDEDYRGDLALAIGWGMTGFGSGQSAKLKEVQLEVSQQTYQNYLWTKVKKDENGIVQEPCGGDSGGPLMHQDAGTGRWTIIGTVYGGGYDCRTGKLDTGSPEGMWNKVTDHLEWIKSVIGK